MTEPMVTPADGLSIQGQYLEASKERWLSIFHPAKYDPAKRQEMNVLCNKLWEEMPAVDRATCYERFYAMVNKLNKETPHHGHPLKR